MLIYQPKLPTKLSRTMSAYLLYSRARAGATISFLSSSDASPPVHGKSPRFTFHLGRRAFAGVVFRGTMELTC